MTQFWNILVFVIRFTVAAGVTPAPDCSFIQLQQTSSPIQPLNACISNAIASCNYNGRGDLASFDIDSYEPNTNCSTLSRSETVQLANVYNYQCESECGTELLPNPITDAPTNRPTNLPTKPPTQSPLTARPTVIGETRPPTNIPTTVSPTQTPSIFLTENIDAYVNDPSQTNILFVLPAIPTEIISFAIIVLLFFGLIYHLLLPSKSKWSKKIVSSIKIPVLSTFICNITAMICILSISLIMYGSEWNIDTYNTAIIPYYILAIAYSFGKFSLVSFFVMRIYNAFKNSATIFQLSKRLCIVLFLCMFVISLMWTVLLIMCIGSGDTNKPYIGYLILAIIECAFVIFLLYLFAKRLATLLLLQGKNRVINVSVICLINDVLRCSPTR